MKLGASPPKGRLIDKDVSSWLNVLRENKLSTEYGENIEVAKLSTTDKEFKNHIDTASYTLFSDKEELNKFIRFTLGLLL